MPSSRPRFVLPTWWRWAAIRPSPPVYCAYCAHRAAYAGRTGLSARCSFSPAQSWPHSAAAHERLAQTPPALVPRRLHSMSIPQEVNRRRTFAIISHPDAGKTTLTEKLLLFAGAIQIAGSVKARKASRHAASDWMEIEKQRGISVASSVMQMEYRDSVINLLDTPGHQDFSEDTYRV